MDAKSYLDKDLLKGMFSQGLMGVETPAEYGGTGRIPQGVEGTHVKVRHEFYVCSPDN
jgi:hypothetical protein